MKTDKVITIFIVTVALAVLGISLYNTYLRFAFKDQAKIEYDRASKIHTILQKGREEFEEKHKTAPEKFSEFVQLDGELEEPYTVTLKDYVQYFAYPDKEKNLNNNEFTVRYHSGCRVTFSIDEETKEIKKIYSFRPYKCRPFENFDS